jgi:ABC-type phosphate transport system substrate-binding protein
MIRIIFLFFSVISLPAIEIVGSDILKETLKNIDKLPGSPKATFNGTMPARRALLEDRASLGIIFLKETDEDPKAPTGAYLNRYLLANATAVLVVHKENQLTQINLEGLRGIFSKSARYPATNWNDLSGSSRSEIISPIIYSPAGSFIQEFFTGFVLNGDEYKTNVKQRLELITIQENIEARFGVAAIMPADTATVGRVMAVSDGRPGRPSVAYLPDEMNIYNGDYPLRLPLYIYVRRDKEKEMSKILSWLLSDEVAERIKKQGLYPAPKSIRARISQRLDR